MVASAGLCPSCSSELGQGREIGAGAPAVSGVANAGIETPAQLPPSRVAKYVSLALAAAIVVGVAAAIMFALAQGGDEVDVEVKDEDYAVAYEDDFLSGSEETLYVTGAANARDLPTTEETEVLRSYAAGDRVEGRWVRGGDRTTRWLRISDDGEVAYIWAGNLGEQAPATAAWLLGTWVFASSCETDNFITYYPSGSFDAYEGSGTYSLEGNTLREVWTTEHPPIGEETSIGDRPIRPPITHTLQLERVGEDAARVTGENGRTDSMTRC